MILSSRPYSDPDNYATSIPFHAGAGVALVTSLVDIKKQETSGPDSVASCGCIHYWIFVDKRVQLKAVSRTCRCKGKLESLARR